MSTVFCSMCHFCPPILEKICSSVKHSSVMLFSYDEKTDTVGMSFTKYKPDKLNPIGKIIMFVYKTLHVVHTEEKKGEDGLYTQCNNMTLINLLLKFLGPLHERTLVIILLGIQVCYESIFLFLITYIFGAQKNHLNDKLDFSRWYTITNTRF